MYLIVALDYETFQNVLSVIAHLKNSKVDSILESF